MRADRASSRRGSLVLIVGVFWGSFAAAQEPLGGVGAAGPARLSINAGYGHSDNIDRGDPGVSSSFPRVGVAFGVGRESRRMTGALAADIELLKYSEEGLTEDDKELLGSIDGVLALALVPDRFAWDFAENLGQTRTDALGALAPNNRERMTVISTGPRLNFRLGGRNSMRLSARTVERTLEDSEFLDSRTDAVQLGLFRTIGPVSEVGIDFAHSEIEFDDTDQQGYEFDAVFLNYDRQFASGGVQARVGEGEVLIGSELSSSALMSFAWLREIGARSSLSILATRELTDAGEVFRLGGIPGVGAPDAVGGAGGSFDIDDARLRDVVLTASPLRRSSIETQFQISGERSTLFFTAGISEDRFEVDSTLDNEGVNLRLSLARNLTALWSAELDVRLWRKDYEAFINEIDEVFSRLALTRHLGRRANLVFSAGHNTRSGASPFDENVYTIWFNYELVQ
jgi:hypothetical protein